MQIAEERLGLKAVEGDIYIDQLDQFAEAGACGTAAVISPIGGIYYKMIYMSFTVRAEVGPVTKRLYEELTGIQFGDIRSTRWLDRSRRIMTGFKNNYKKSALTLEG